MPKVRVSFRAETHPIGQDIPWQRSKLARLRPALSLADPALEDNEGLQLSVTFNPAKAERLFVDSGHSFAEIMKLAEAGKPLPRFTIPASVRASVKFEKKIVESQNVAGILPGHRSRAEERIRCDLTRESEPESRQGCLRSQAVLTVPHSALACFLPTPKPI